MREPRLVGARPEVQKSENPTASHSTSLPAPSNEVVFVRREECRKCPSTIWASYYFVDGEEAGWGCSPIGPCGRPDRCGEKLSGLDDDDLALVDPRPAGAA
jgi:hypothetical protein